MRIKMVEEKITAEQTCREMCNVRHNLNINDPADKKVFWGEVDRFLGIMNIGNANAENRGEDPELYALHQKFIEKNKLEFRLITKEDSPGLYTYLDAVQEALYFRDHLEKRSIEENLSDTPTEEKLLKGEYSDTVIYDEKESFPSSEAKKPGIYEPQFSEVGDKLCPPKFCRYCKGDEWDIFQSAWTNPASGRTSLSDARLFTCRGCNKRGMHMPDVCTPMRHNKKYDITEGKFSDIKNRDTAITEIHCLIDDYLVKLKVRCHGPGVVRSAAASIAHLSQLLARLTDRRMRVSQIWGASNEYEMEILSEPLREWLKDVYERDKGES